MDNIIFSPLRESEREKFIYDLQKSFEIAFKNEFGEDEEDVIPRRDIEESLDKEGAESFNILQNNKIIGGFVVVINHYTQHNSLDLLFIKEEFNGKGIGLRVWKKIEEKYPKTKVWETATPYFEKRNINFYVNKCGFSIVEFFNNYHRGDNKEFMEQNNSIDEFFIFRKNMK